MSELKKASDKFRKRGRWEKKKTGKPNIDQQLKFLDDELRKKREQIKEREIIDNEIK